MTLPAMLPFLSDEHNVDDPSCYLADFRAPKLRQFPKPPNSLRWKCFLGAGENGFVISAKTVTRSMVAVKFVGAVCRIATDWRLLTHIVLP